MREPHPQVPVLARQRQQHQSAAFFSQLWPPGLRGLVQRRRPRGLLEGHLHRRPSHQLHRNSLVASHARVAGDDGVCQTNFNVSSSIALSLFTISPHNRALCFLYGCNNGTEPIGPDFVNATSNCSAAIYAYLGGEYSRDRPPEIASGGCNLAYMPVLESEAAVMTAANYSRLLKDGFMLDWDPEVSGVGDCRACNATGGQCRYDSDAAEFRCLCPGGRRARSTCAGANLAGEVVGVSIEEVTVI